MSSEQKKILLALLAIGVVFLLYRAMKKKVPCASCSTPANTPPPPAGGTPATPVKLGAYMNEADDFVVHGDGDIPRSPGAPKAYVQMGARQSLLGGPATGFPFSRAPNDAIGPLHGTPSNILGGVAIDANDSPQIIALRNCQALGLGAGSECHQNAMMLAQ